MSNNNQSSAVKSVVKYDSRTNKLAAKINAVNRANAYVGELYEQLVKVFEPFVGELVLKADGSLLKKVSKLLPDFPYGGALSVHQRQSGYSIQFVVKTCESILDAESCLYHETTVYVGELACGVLVGITPPPPQFPVYDLDQALVARQRVKDAQEALSRARDGLYPFGEYY